MTAKGPATHAGPMGTPTTAAKRHRWAGYAAAALAFSFAAVNVYWGLGGRRGVATLGGSIEELAATRDPLLLGLNWASAALKAAGGVLALALVQPWGQRLPRRPLIAAAWSAAAILTAYGAIQTISVLLVWLEVAHPTEPVDPAVRRWRLLLWEPWFLVWGLLLAATARRTQQLHRTEEFGERIALTPPSRP